MKVIVEDEKITIDLDGSANQTQGQLTVASPKLFQPVELLLNY